MPSEDVSFESDDRDRSRKYDRDRERDRDRPKSSRDSRRDKDKDRRDDRDRDRRRERDRDRERDSRRDRRDDKDRKPRSKSRSPSRSRSRSKSPGAKAGSEKSSKGSVNSSGEAEMSIEETNKLRISLGLKPLKIEDKAKQEKEKEQAKEEAMKQQKIIELTAKIETAKKKRESRAKMVGKSLGEELEEEDGGAAAWVATARVKQEEQIKKERELALKREQLLDELEQEKEEEEEDRRRKNKISSGYTSNDLKGMKVAHDMEDIGEAQGEIILTIKDTSVLKDGKDINDDDGIELENVNISEKERFKKYQEMKKKKPIYNAYDDSIKEILPQYSDNKDKDDKDRGFVIGSNDDISSKLDEMKKKMMILKEKQSNQLSLDMDKKYASEYMSKEEMESKYKIKNKKKVNSNEKKKKLRKKQDDDDDDVVDSNRIAENSKNIDHMDDSISSNIDHGSRSESAKIKSKKDQEIADKVRRSKNYEKAKTRAAEETKALFDKDRDNVNNDDDDDRDLIESLAKAREIASQKSKKLTSEELILQRMKQSKESTSMSDIATEEGIVFTSTTEFVRGIQTDVDILSSNTNASSISSLSIKKPIKVNQDKMDLEESAAVMAEEQEEHEKMLREQSEKQQRKRKAMEESERKIREDQDDDNEENDKVDRMDEDHDDDDDKDDEEGGRSGGVLDDEPVAGSLAATLALLRKTNAAVADKEIEETTWVGRKNDKKNLKKDTNDPAPQLRLEYRDENGRILTPKEAFRILSHKFHGKAPGKNKQAKRMKQLEEEAKRRKLLTGEGALKSVEALIREQERREAPFIVLSGKNVSDSSSSSSISKSTSSSSSSSTHTSSSTTNTTSSSYKTNASSPSSSSPPHHEVNVLKGGKLEGSFQEFKLEGFSTKKSNSKH